MLTPDSASFFQNTKQSISRQRRGVRRCAPLLTSENNQKHFKAHAAPLGLGFFFWVPNPGVHIPG